MTQSGPIRQSLRSDQSNFTAPRSPWRAIALKLALVAAVVGVTNPGVLQRVDLLLDNGRFGTLLPYVAIWGLTLVAIAVAALLPKWWMRAPWALLLAASTAASVFYYKASSSEMNVFDVLTLWNARHEAGRASELYLTAFPWAIGAFLMMAFSILMPGSLAGRAGTYMKRAAILPVVPMLAIGGIVYMKAGGGSQAMPQQYTPAALASIAAAKVMTQGVSERGEVPWTPNAAPKQNIVILMDESIGADFIDFTPGNNFTPKMADLAPKFVNYGRASSGGNCSNYSNALMRMAASRKDVVQSVNTSPTLWQYARKAGFRTVFIDAQAGNISNPGLMQNFMTVKERESIDEFHAIRGVAAHEADMKLAEIVAEELKEQGPVFIYANKNGAHFLYDDAYPSTAAAFGPIMSESVEDTSASRLASYRNAIRWSVDEFMARLFSIADFSNTTLVYTSDHAQIFDPDRLTHCIVDSPDTAMAVVPLLVATSDDIRRSELENGTKLLANKASHFQIAPTVLAWMGYAKSDIQSRYDESLTEASKRDPAFTSGDVFGLFSSDILWWPVDLGKTQLDPAAQSMIPSKSSS